MSLVVDGIIGRPGFSLSVSLTVNAGEALGLVGRNGSGKSTLVHTVAGLCAMQSGSVSFDGVTWDSGVQRGFVPPEDRRCAVVFQDIRLFPHMTCRENVSFGLRCAGVSNAEAVARAQQQLVSVGASDIADRRATALSGGQAQRVALARALVLEPRVLLLDEPLSAVDGLSRPALRELIAEALSSFAGAAIVVSHDELDVASLASRVQHLGPG